MPNSSAVRATVDVGSVIAETYTIESLLGRGGMGSVFLASHNRLPGKKVAIKLLHADLVDDEVLARFKREAQIATQLDHPNIVRVDDFLTLPDGTPCMLLEYLQGETLAQRLRAGPLALEHALSIVRQIGSALSAAHRAGIVHRDLKPQNIFLVASEHDGRATEVAKVLDFGISKIRGSQTVKTQESSLLGTPQYMAPEQATGQHSAVDERTDVFAFGAIVYEMLSGQPAFQGASIPEVVFKVVYEQPIPLTTLAPTIPTSVTDAVAHAMMKAADQRYANVGQFIEALTGQPISQFRINKVPLPERAEARDDAFAQTVGSGDHKDSITPLQGSPPQVNAMAATVDSQSRKPDTVPSPPPVMVAKPRSSLLVPAIVLAGLAIAGAIVFLAMHGKGGEDAPVATVAVVTPAPAPAKPEDVPKPVVHDPVVVPAAPAIDAGVADATVAPIVKDHAAKPVAPPPDTKTYDNEAEAKERLGEAAAAYASGNCATARGAANSVKYMHSIRPEQKSDALGYIGACACTASNDLDGANTAYRQTPPGSIGARRIDQACKAAGIPISRS